MAKFVSYAQYAKMFCMPEMEDDGVDPCPYCLYSKEQETCERQHLCKGGLFIRSTEPIPKEFDWIEPRYMPEDEDYVDEPKIPKPQSEPLKYNEGKPFVELVLGDFAAALLEVAKVGTMGAKKYSPHGWKENDTPFEGKITQIDDAKGRHRLAHQMGEEVDPESGLLHRAHEAWNALAALTLIMEKRNGTGDGS